MNQLAAMRVFRLVAELESFSAAADRLNLSNGAVSKQVSALEHHLGVQLLLRTTRRLSLTDSGRGYLERCARILDDVDECEQALSRQHTAPRGLLRVSAPVTLSVLQLGAVFARFLLEHPEIRLDLSVNDRFVDPIEEGFDVVLRVIGQLPDSTLIARRLATVDYVICAAPAYLKRAGTPKQPQDLRAHDCLLYAQPTPVTTLRLSGPDGERQVSVAGRYQCNNSIPLRDAVVAGLGVALMPTLYVSDLLDRGKLVRLLPRYRFEPAALYALYPHTRHLSAKVKVLIDFLIERLTPRQA